MYIVNYYLKGVSGIVPQLFNTKKEAHAEMIGYIDSDKQRLLKAGYSRIGSLKSGTIQYKHPVYGIDSQVSIGKL